jgi:hypothetical protein
MYWRSLIILLFGRVYLSGFGFGSKVVVKLRGCQMNGQREESDCKVKEIIEIVDFH